MLTHARCIKIDDGHHGNPFSIKEIGVSKRKYTSGYGHVNMRAIAGNSGITRIGH